jgi:manganese transport protein
VKPLRTFLRDIGPGALVTAAFVGPGTVTVCTLAGAGFGYSLLWALVFATAATIVFQEMAGRLGAVAQKGLGEALRESFAGTLWKWPLFALIAVALYAGNAAYEAGNLAGAALGVEALTGAPGSFRASVAVVAAIAAAALWHGSYRQLERLLLALVLLMALAFIGTFLVTRPDLAALGRGLVTPRVSSASLPTVIALIGTTVVPYNLFLHATAARSKWNGAGDLPAVRADALVSIGLGGLVSILIVSTAAASLFARGLEVDSAAAMALQLEPLFGRLSAIALGIGLCAAGLTSALTAPLATAYAVSEIIGPAAARRTVVFRITSLSVVAVGAASALSGIRPITLIVAAQFANGLLLPIVALFLLRAVNDQRLLGSHANGPIANMLGAVVLLVALGLGVRLVLSALGI